MQIWVDADACPQVIKSILFRAADRARVPVTLVANKKLRTGHSPYVRSLQVMGGPDAADDEIARLMEAGDLVITADIPLASRVVEAGGTALDPRGELYTEETVGQRRAVRDLLDELRSEGMRTGGPKPISQAHRKAFANQLDRLLARRDQS